MTLLEEWREKAYQVGNDQKAFQAFWDEYFAIETEMYKKLLSSDKVFTGTIPALCKEFGVEQQTMVGFLDGINDSLKEQNPIETMTTRNKLSLDYDEELLYKNMVINKAQWLYELPEWESHLSEERRAELYKEAKRANTIVKPKKIGRNDPCPCGSGKKYKFCCGK